MLVAVDQFNVEGLVSGAVLKDSLKLLILCGKNYYLLNEAAYFHRTLNNPQKLQKFYLEELLGK
jgi:hypothetical protein